MLGVAAIVVLLVAATRWLLRARPPDKARRGPATAAAAVYLAAVGAQYARSIPQGYLAADAVDRVLWAVQGATLLAIAAAVAWEPIRRRRAHARLAQLVVELQSQPTPRSLRDVLADMLADPGLGLAYPLTGGGRVGADGRPAAPSPGQAVTVLRDGDRPLADVYHSRGLLDDPAIAAATASAARLALHNEGLRAELLARVEDLRAMRCRIVAAGDGERRQLERDLHDGAQQRLATLAIALESARRRGTEGEHAAALASAHAEVRAALAELREIAHGLVPAVSGRRGTRGLRSRHSRRPPTPTSGCPTRCRPSASLPRSRRPRTTS